ncbi:MAG: ATPase domain-containing protein [Acidobacteriota bacterium]
MRSIPDAFLRCRVSTPGESVAGVAGCFLSTGIQDLDRILGGGLPRGKVSEIVGSLSSGKTSLLFSILARATSGGELAVYIDTSESFDPAFGKRAGIDLPRLLWIRCRGCSPEQRAAKALKAADILVRAQGFGVLALDLESAGKRGERNPLSSIPFNVWFRLKHAVEGKPTTILLLGREACSGGASSVVLALQRFNASWRPSTLSANRNASRMSGHNGVSPERPQHSRLLRGMASEVHLLGGKNHGHVTIYSDF